MKRIKKLIIILLIVFIVVLLGKLMINKIYEKMYPDGLGADFVDKPYLPTPERNASVFYTVEDCVQNFINYTIQKEDADKLNNNTILYYLLDPDYINRNSITVDNISDYILFTNIPVKFTALKMEYLCYDNNLQEYRVYGKINKEETGEFIKYGFFKITLDVNKMVYCIDPIDNCNSIEDIHLDKYEINKQIEKKEQNSFSYLSISNTKLMNNYLKYIKETLLNSPEEIYYILDNDYKTNNFPTLESFKAFVEKNKDIIEEIELNKCEIKDMVINPVFTCEDYNNKKYIIKQQAIMDFSLVLEY